MEQYLQLNSCLVLELLLVADDLDCNNLAGLVVHTLQCLAERAFSEEINDLKSVSDVILENYVVVASFVIVAVIVLLLLRSFYFLRAQSEEIANFVVEYFTLFVLRETWLSQKVPENFGT